MAIKYIPYTTDPLRGQAVLPFLRYHSQLLAKDFMLKGLPYYETELIEKVNGGGNNLVINGDCLNACAYLKEKDLKVDLVYIDPPFASGANYAKKIYIRKNPKLVAKLEEAEEALRKQRTESGAELDNTDLQAIEEIMYGDIWQKEDYLNWMYERLLAIKEVMNESASIYVHLDWNIGHYVKVLLDEIFGEENFRNEIVWCYSGGGIPGDRFPNKHDTIFWYVNNEKDYLYHREFRDYSEGTKQRGRTKVKGEDAKLRAEGTPIEDWWTDIPKITSPDDQEKLIAESYSTQKPEALLKRIIETSSDTGMLVADFFGGSGVTAAAAQKLERHFITADVGLNSIHITRDRLVQIGANFDILKIKDGIDLFRNPEQTMEKLATVIPGISTKHDYDKFWFGAITEDGKVCPCWVPNLLDKSQAILNAALFTKILDETAKLENVSKVVICSVDKIDDKEIDKMISDYDLRDSDGKKIEFVFKDLKELTDLLVYPDIVEYTLTEKNGTYEISFDRFVSDNLMKKINEYNAKKQSKKKQQELLAKTENEEQEEETSKTKIDISEGGLELIEYISVDGTHKAGAWKSDQEIKIDKKGYIIKNGEKTKKFWDGKIILDKKPLRLKIRNIAGDETIISLQ